MPIVAEFIMFILLAPPTELGSMYVELCKKCARPGDVWWQSFKLSSALSYGITAGRTRYFVEMKGFN